MLSRADGSYSGIPAVEVGVHVLELVKTVKWSNLRGGDFWFFFPFFFPIILIPSIANMRQVRRLFMYIITWVIDVHVDAQQHGTVRGSDVHYQNLIKMTPGNNTKPESKKKQQK